MPSTVLTVSTASSHGPLDSPGSLALSSPSEYSDNFAVSSCPALPSELWEWILDKLVEEHESSLRAFACASRTCYALASQQLHRTLTFTPFDPTRSFRDVIVATFTKLKRHDGLRHVRTLVLERGRNWPYDSFDLPNPIETSVLHSIGSIIQFGQDDNKRLHGTLDPHCEFSFSVPMPKTLRLERHFINTMWRPLADFIKCLPSLTDFFFLCDAAFPRGVLQVLHRYKPNCRLHICKFQLDDLVNCSPKSYGFELASSPCIHSVGVQYYGRFPSGFHENLDPSLHHREVVMQMTSGLAPNLKELTLGVSLRRLPSFLPALNPTLPAWKGFGQAQESAPKTHRCSLRSLRLVNFGLIPRREIEVWKECLDFSALQVLKLEGHLDIDVLRYLTVDFDFPSLKTLTLTHLGFWRKVTGRETFHVDANVFIRKAPPLRSLTLGQWYAKIGIGLIVGHHGARLIELNLLQYNGPEIRVKDLVLIARHCPLLELFKLTLQRTQGDINEVALYKALGSIRRLQYIQLQLDVADHHYVVDDQGNAYTWPCLWTLFPPFAECLYQTQIRADGSNAPTGEIRARLINCAIDGRLACSIFDAISSGKPAGSLPLEKLSIRVAGRTRYPRNVGCPRQLSAVLDYMCRPWKVNRGIRDDCRNVLVAVQEPCPDDLLIPQNLKHYLFAIWQTIWPLCVFDDWRYDWCSLPLAEF